uniref:phage terminase small subunit n=1 Tax=Streptomyces roseoverticillatus TaxID=66429 RepID=UPI001F1963D3|nr:hypothetical protein [Streptomyces roseoverticillatus]
MSEEPVEGRALPKSLGIQTTAARRFWKTWATAPQTQRWAETDWAELEITVKLVDAFYLGDAKLAGEIRQRVGRWGATTEDRARLRMSFDQQAREEREETSEPPRGVTSIDRYRQAFTAP